MFRVCRVQGLGFRAWGLGLSCQGLFSQFGFLLEGRRSSTTWMGFQILYKTFDVPSSRDLQGRKAHLGISSSTAEP